MIKVDIVDNEKGNLRHLYFETSSREDREGLELLDKVYQALAESSDPTKSRGEYVNSYCFRLSVKMPREKVQPMPESSPSSKPKSSTHER